MQASDNPRPHRARPLPKPQIIAVDFDGTVVTHDYPDVGEELRYAKETLWELVWAGHRLILNTMRSGPELDAAVAWFKDRKIDLWGVNRNPEQDSWTSSPKCYAHIYIDDAALGAPVVRPTAGDRARIDWMKVREWLVERDLL